MKEPRPSIYFATGNRSKFLEAARIAKLYGLELRQLKLRKREIQSDRLSEIASFSALNAARLGRCEVVAEDSGFFVDALRGFPGPYSSYVYRTLGVHGLLRLMEKVREREASFEAVVAYCTPRGQPICFRGVVKGHVSDRPMGEHGFGFDPIFIPNEGDGRSFAQMRVDEKNKFSHRAMAFRRFSNWYAMNR